MRMEVNNELLISLIDKQASIDVATLRRCGLESPTPEYFTAFDFYNMFKNEFDFKNVTFKNEEVEEIFRSCFESHVGITHE